MREFFHNMKLSFLLAARSTSSLAQSCSSWARRQRHRVLLCLRRHSCSLCVVTIVSFFSSGLQLRVRALPRYRRCGPGLLFLLRPVIVASVLPRIGACSSWWTAWSTSNGRWSCAGRSSPLDRAPALFCLSAVSGWAIAFSPSWPRRPWCPRSSGGRC